ncbi:MAG TPA: hypothetical protein VNO33_06710, partial [Kofleriaceae bacterium]|nr:hypothetical protein [Kofleriaceae bacterium]
DRCADPAALLSPVPLPAAPIAGQVGAIDRDLERARVLLLTGRPEARSLAVEAVAGARRLAYPPLLARALLVLGRVEMGSPSRQDALPPLDEAIRLALAAGDDALAVEAFARRAWVDATSPAPDFERAVAGLPLVEALASRLGPGERFARALLYNNLGGVELARGSRPAARAAFERALVESRGVTGPGSIELAKLPAHLALVVDDPGRSTALFAQVIDELTGALGRDHPMTLEVRIMAGVMAPDPAASRRILEPACSACTRLHPTFGMRAADCWFEVGWLAQERGDVDGVATAMEEVVSAAARGADPRRADLARAHIALARGRNAAALAGFADVVRQVGPLADQPWWIVWIAGEAELGAGLSHRASGQARAAEAALDRSLVHFERVASAQPATYIQRRLARVRAELARLRAARGASRSEIAPLARAAADWYRAAGGQEATLDRLAPLTVER